ncbi:MAG TPA: ion channel [Beijerinckiaceae bacterium]|nr:ion channel [Beijerinckiaceae bacterium]HVB89149.1 ion channel [Beijerinckiaceae bacterium]
MDDKAADGRKTRTKIVKIGDRRFLTRGLDTPILGDFYHRAMTVSWPVFFSAFALAFLAMNAIFALIYRLGAAPIANARPGSLSDLFFFSIETLATVGYGDMHPQTLYGHSVATAEIFTGMSGIAVVTGLVFSRFSRPRARLIFARHPIVGPHNGRTCLMLRMANARHNLISEATAKLWVLLEEEFVEGGRFRRFHELTLERSQNPVFALSWTLFHAIDENSLLHGLGPAELEQADASFIVTFSGLDENSGQRVNARQGYGYQDLRWGHTYADVLDATDDGVPKIDYTKFHDTIPTERAE